MLSAIFNFLNSDGEQEERKVVYLRAESAVLGHRVVASQIRHKL